ncbi:MAG: hypothetical protein PHS57_03940 [Alphaproteobacteria bacterium]|nr:hypothetical protein [Alphaproteobacteria bacterium]
MRELMIESEGELVFVFYKLQESFCNNNDGNRELGISARIYNFIIGHTKLDWVRFKIPLFMKILYDVEKMRFDLLDAL